MQNKNYMKSKKYILLYSIFISNIKFNLKKFITRLFKSKKKESILNIYLLSNIYKKGQNYIKHI